METPSACAACGGDSPKSVLTADAAHAIDLLVCPACGLRWLQPQPSEEQLTARYVATYYSYAPRKRRDLKQRLWMAMRDAASLPAGSRSIGVWLLSPVLGPLARWCFDVVVPIVPGRTRVLEVGCGAGDLLAYLQSRGCECLGIERSAEAVAAAARRGLEVRDVDITQLGEPPGSFDVAIFLHSLEHLRDPARCLRTAATLLKPGGRLFITVPNGESAGLRVQGVEWGSFSYPEHLWFFSPPALARLVTAVGFSVDGIGFKTVWPDHRARWRFMIRAGEFRRFGRELREVVGAYVADRRLGDLLRLSASRR